MAANNFFAYPAPPHPVAQQPAPGGSAYTAVAVAASPAGQNAQAVAAAAAAAAYQQQQTPVAVAGVQPAPPNAVAYNQAAVAASAASNYRSGPQTVVAYTTYQPSQTGANYIATSATGAAVITPVVSGTYPAASSYSQYPPQQQPAALGQVYDPSKSTYYQAPTVTVTYSVADPHYQARPVYSANSTLVVRPANAIISGPPRPSYTTYPQSGSTTSYTYGGAAPVAISAVAAAPKHVYVHNQTAVPNMPPMLPNKGHQQQWNVRPNQQQQVAGSSGQRAFKARIPPKAQQLHYCEVCKISCAGPQTYKEHIEGQKHKKKEAAMKGGTPCATTKGGNALRCELCDVTCTGSDAYAAHIRGAKHQKVVKLHTKLGKPIPSVDPVLVMKSDGNCVNESQNSSSSAVQQQPLVQKPPTYVAPKALSIPKINFVGPGHASQVKSEPQQAQVAKEVSNKNNLATIGPSIPQQHQPQQSGNPAEVNIPRLPDEKEVTPVGHDYIEEIKNDDGKVVSFNCKLCECRFNDPNAKEMHMKGRRHRLQFKKKVNPDLVVDVKPSLRQRKLAEERAKRTQAREEFWRRREEEFRLVEEEERAFWEERRRFDEEQQQQNEFFDFNRVGGGGFGPPGRILPPPMGMGPPRGYGPPPIPPFMFGFHNMMMRRPDTVDDRHVLAKHSDVYPEDEVLDEIQKIVAVTEKALKLVSDEMLEADLESKEAKKAKKSSANEESEEEKNKRNNANRVLKGVMRVGVLAKGLILKGDDQFHLVALCNMKPTQLLLNKIFTLLPDQLELASEEIKFSVEKKDQQGCLLLTHEDQKNRKIKIRVTLTSPLIREESSGPDPEDMINPEKCMEALAELRHAKWFQARAQGRQSCVMIIRILRDFCLRDKLAWKNLELFPLELLVEKVLSSSAIPLSPGDALRRVFESVASGLLLSEQSPGLLDPCEKEPRDAAGGLTKQQREDITFRAQNCLRMIAFRQVHNVLGMDPLPPPKFGKFGRFTRKRRRDESMSDGGEGELDEKKDKKGGEEEEEEDGQDDDDKEDKGSKKEVTVKKEEV